MATRDYSNGKVYKIIANNADENEQCYVGSTSKQYLSQRFVAHKSLYNSWKEGKTKHKHAMAYDLFDKYGIENCSIILIESVNAKTKDELLAREKYYYLSLNCNNKKSPISSVEERRLKSIEYNLLNKAKIDLYRQNNKEFLSVAKKEYYKNNKEHLKGKQKINGKIYIEKMKETNIEEYKLKVHETYIRRVDKHKEYYNTNKEKIKEYKHQLYLNNNLKLQEKIKCECGFECMRKSFNQHKKTLRHKSLMELKT